MNDNPLLDFSGLPRFADIRAEHVAPAITELLAKANAALDQVSADTTPAEWDQVVVPLDDASEHLSRAWGVIAHLNAVADTPELRAAYNEMQPAVTEFGTRVGQSLALFEKYKALAAAKDYAQLPQARKTIISHALRDFRLGGAELNDADKSRFASIQDKQAASAIRFSENVLDATNDFALFVDDVKELSGLPEDVIAAARAAAEQDAKSGYKFTLHFPSYFPVLQYADQRSLREAIYRANATKASELGAKPEWDNSQVMTELLQLRKEEAQLLGYPAYADVSLAAKMAESPAQVTAFLEDLAQRARPFAEKDLEELRAFAASELNLPDLQAWDITYASEKLRQQRYAFSEQEVKEYFPENKVLAGLFDVIQRLFGVSIQAEQTATWHPDVKFFRIERNGQLLGQFYLDLYARAGKRGGAWMDDARGRRALKDGIQTPVAYLVCNFSAPVTLNGVQRPALFTHDDVITLFHEFGHGLHHLLTQVDELAVSGISGVEWDAVELPSQFMENFCWEWDVLQSMTAHVENGQPLPRSLYDKMIAAKNFQAGLQTLRQVEFALLDMRLHHQAEISDAASVQSVIDDVRKQFAVLISPAFNRMQHSFSHIFAGGYAAGYYSYKWAEVLSADAYAAFEESRSADGSTLSAETGQRFLREVLEAGGSRPALDSFTAFRGRAPDISALLRHSGMTA